MEMIFEIERDLRHAGPGRADGRVAPERAPCGSRRQHRRVSRKRSGRLAEGDRLGDQIWLAAARPFGVGDDAVADGVGNVEPDLGAAALVIDQRLRAELLDFQIEGEHEAVGGVGLVDTRIDPARRGAVERPRRMELGRINEGGRTAVPDGLRARHHRAEPVAA